MMRLEFSENSTDIKSIICHPDIFCTVSCDGSPSINEFEIDFNNVGYILGYVDDQPIACFVLHQTSGHVMQVHIHVLPEFRSNYAMLFAVHGINLMFNTFDILKVNAEIPSLYPNVINFAKCIGFEEEGCNKLSFKKDGIVYDQMYLGLSYESFYINNMNILHNS